QRARVGIAQQPAQGRRGAEHQAEDEHEAERFEDRARLARIDGIQGVVAGPTPPKCMPGLQGPPPASTQASAHGPTRRSYGDCGTPVVTWPTYVLSEGRHSRPSS